MIFTKPAHRIIAPTGEITEKPTVPFSPNYGDPLFPTKSAHFFTNLIAGQTDYIEDSIATQGDFVNSGNSSFGQFAKGEGFQAIVGGAGDGGYPFAHPMTDSFVMIIECTMTRVDSRYTYLGGWSTSTSNVFGPRNVNCSEQGIFYSDGIFCLGNIGDGELHRIGIKCWKRTGNNQTTIVVDGIVLEDEINHLVDTVAQTIRIGMNGNGRGETIMATGIWHWATSGDGADPLPKADLIEMTTNPWPHLVVLD